MAVILVLSLGTLLDAGFDQVFMLLNGATLEVGDIIDTYVYRVGLLEANFELATAVGLFKGVVGMILIISANACCADSGSAPYGNARTIHDRPEVAAVNAVELRKTAPGAGPGPESTLGRHHDLRHPPGPALITLLPMVNVLARSLSSGRDGVRTRA